MGATTGVVLTPYPSARPASATMADAYGSAFGPRTAQAGSEGPTKARAAAGLPSPIQINGLSSDFLRQPAGGLLVLIGALLALRFLDGRS